MASKPAIEVVGSDQLRRELKRLGDDLQDLKDLHREGAEVVQRRAVQLVPRRTGALAGSGRSSGQARQGVVRFGSGLVRHAGPIHFGWPAHGIAPQPFLYDALDDRATEVLELYEDRIMKLADEAGLTTK